MKNNIRKIIKEEINKFILKENLETTKKMQNLFFTKELAKFRSVLIGLFEKGDDYIYFKRQYSELFDNGNGEVLLDQALAELKNNKNFITALSLINQVSKNPSMVDNSITNNDVMNELNSIPQNSNNPFIKPLVQYLKKFWMMIYGTSTVANALNNTNDEQEFLKIRGQYLDMQTQNPYRI